MRTIHSPLFELKHVTIEELIPEITEDRAFNMVEQYNSQIHTGDTTESGDSTYIRDMEPVVDVTNEYIALKLIHRAGYATTVEELTDEVIEQVADKIQEHFGNPTHVLSVDNFNHLVLDLSPQTMRLKKLSPTTNHGALIVYAPLKCALIKTKEIFPVWSLNNDKSD